MLVAIVSSKVSVSEICIVPVYWYMVYGESDIHH